MGWKKLDRKTVDELARKLVAYEISAAEAYRFEATGAVFVRIYGPFQRTGRGQQQMCRTKATDYFVPTVAASAEDLHMQSIRRSTSVSLAVFGVSADQCASKLRQGTFVFVHDDLPSGLLSRLNLLMSRTTTASLCTLTPTLFSDLIRKRQYDVRRASRGDGGSDSDGYDIHVLFGEGDTARVLTASVRGDEIRSARCNEPTD
jgi:hypothetical protein